MKGETLQLIMNYEGLNSLAYNEGTNILATYKYW
jgi:hypothetical protein